MLGFVMLLLCSQNSTEAKAAASPRFKNEKIELTGIGEVRYIEILNKVKDSKYKWSSSNEKVARVSNNGLVTAVGIGNAKIKCKITYKSGKTKTLSCNVTVTVPATDIKINNAKITNGTHVMRVGESYKFECTLSPYNTTDKVFWSLDATDPNTNINAVRIDDSSKGVVTAQRRGRIVLVATAAKEAAQKAAKQSDVKDAVIIEVVGPSAEVVSAEILDSKTIRVVFGTEIRESTVIKSDGKLSDNITIDRLTDSLGNKAADPGNLTAILSKNMKTLTITTTNSLNGYYGMSFSNGVLTDDGSPIYKDYINLSYINEENDDKNNDNDTDTDTDDDNVQTDKDTQAPTLSGTMLEDDGMTNTISFSEKMDFGGLQISNARAVSGSVTVSPVTLNFLNSESNYSFSADGKSIIINLSGISSEDYNKSFYVTISGITDKAGNRLKDGSTDVILRTSTLPMPQARPVSIVRTSYDTLTATFTRSIKVPGYAIVANSGYFYGKVNPENNKQVIYTISDYEASLTGTQTVSIGYWDSYNVMENDTSADKLYDFNVNFTTEKVRPILTTYKFNSEQRILTLTYSEKVSASFDTGYLDYTLSSYKYDDLIGSLEYTVISSVDNVIEIALKNLTLYGNYTFELPEGFAWDNYRNQSYSKKITLYNVSGTNGENKLPEPYNIYQSDINNSIIYIEFADRLDAASALDESNYTIAGASIEEIKLVQNNEDGAIIQIILAKGSVTSNGKRTIRISGIKGFNGSYTEMDSYTTNLNLVENTDPQLKNIVYDSTAKDTINLVFTENIKGSISVNVQERYSGYSIGNTVTILGDTASIKLDSIPADGTHLVIYILDNKITDLNGNESTLNPVLNTFVNY